MTRAVIPAIALCVLGGTLSAQQPPAKTPPRMEHQMGHDMQGMDHAMSPWKELDAFHMLMMATWHPAKDKGDLAPARAKIGEMLASAKALAASTAPKGCDAPAMQTAAKALPAETQKVADLVSKKADDAVLKSAMSALHEKFDVLEMGCTMPKDKKN